MHRKTPKNTVIFLFESVDTVITSQEFQSAFIDITERYHQRKDHETSRYLKALTEVYDKIFEYDLAGRTVKCLYGQHSPAFQWLENIPMQMEDATEKWITSSAEEQDRDNLHPLITRLFKVITR